MTTKTLTHWDLVSELVQRIRNRAWGPGWHTHGLTPPAHLMSTCRCCPPAPLLPRNTSPIGAVTQVQDQGRVCEAQCKEAWLSELCKCRADPAAVASQHFSPGVPFSLQPSPYPTTCSKLETIHCLNLGAFSEPRPRCPETWRK